MRFIPAPLSFPAAIFEAMFVPRISYCWYDKGEDRGSAARKNTDKPADNWLRWAGRLHREPNILTSDRAEQKEPWRSEVGVSIQVAILKVLASHGSGRATLASLKRDIAILSTSGPDWTARLKRLAGRVPVIDIFGSGHVLRDDEGWQITPSGRDFLRALEAVSQDNQPLEAEPLPHAEAAGHDRGALIVVGHRFKNRLRRHREPAPQRDQRRVPRHDSNA
jgi:hypothetical protein